MAGSASASSWLGHATRTIWQPAAVSSAICCRVALTSAVSVVVIDWTDTGAPPPTGTDPTSIRREARRVATDSGTEGRPRSTVVRPEGALVMAEGTIPSLERIGHRINDIRSEQQD